MLLEVTWKFSLPIADKYVIATKNEICTKRIYELKKYMNTNTNTNIQIQEQIQEDDDDVNGWVANIQINKYTNTGTNFGR